MEFINFYQALIFFVQTTLVASLILFLFRIRTIMGLGLLFAALGLFQFMQVFLSYTLYVELAKGIIFSPGSSVLFTCSLFAVLLIYIKEDVFEIRKIIYALISANLVMSILLYSFGWSVKESNTFNPYNVSIQLFNKSAWILIIGTIVLFFDSILIIVSYEFIAKIFKNLFVRIFITMLFVVSFDTIGFSLGAFWNNENLSTILYSGLLSKGIAVLLYSAIFSIYLLYIEKETFVNTFTFKDIFYAHSYREKYELVNKEKELILKEAEKAIQLSESKYRTLATISPVGIFLTKADGETLYVNPKWCSMAGLSEAEALGQGWLQAVHPDDKQKLKDGWNKAVQNLTSSYTEFRFLHKNGSTVWVLGQAVPEVDQDNNIIGYVGTTTDITEIKQFELKLNRLKDKAEESDKLKSAFLANMSHEIRTPMNGILGFSELLKNPDLSGKAQQEYIKIIEKSGLRMLNIINNIIDLSKIESNQMEVLLTEVELNKLMDEIFEFFKSETDQKGIQLSLRKGLGKYDNHIITDKNKLTGILTNLVKNAIKYTKKGRIEIGYYLKERNELEFYVADTGIGIPKNRLSVIFDRFIQADITDSMALQGAGLGLSISKAYVEMLGGTIYVESNLNLGSKFYFTHPYNPLRESETKNHQTLVPLPY